MKAAAAAGSLCICILVPAAAADITESRILHMLPPHTHPCSYIVYISVNAFVLHILSC